MNPHLAVDRLQKLTGEHKNKSQFEKNVRVSFVRVMQYVGGYDAVMRLPLPAYFEIVHALNEIDKHEFEKEKALAGAK